MISVADKPNKRNLVPRRQAAEYLGIKEQTLAVWACSKRYTLPFIRVGRRVMYDVADLDAFLDANRVTCES